MEEKKLTEKESLEVITMMINRTKARYLESGKILLVWGYLITVIAIAVWILIASTHQRVWNWLWCAIPIVGFPVTTILARRKKRESGAVTYSDRISSRLWTIFGLSVVAMTLICIGFSVIGGVNSWGAMLPFCLLLAPGAEIAQGLIVKEKCLVGAGIFGLSVGMFTLCCVVGGIALKANWYMPVFILTWIVMMILPWHMLNRKALQG